MADSTVIAMPASTEIIPLLPPGVSLLSLLPTELLDQIIRHAAGQSNLRSTRALRLVCKVFNALASQYGLPSMTAFLHQSDFNAVRTLAAQPHIAMGVRSFTYVPDLIVKPLSLEEFRYEYKDLRKMDINEALTPAMRRRLRKKAILTTGQIHTHWQRAKALYNMQKSLMDDEDDIEFLMDVLPLFPNLNEISMQSEVMALTPGDDPNTRVIRRRPRTPFDDGLAEFSWRPLQPEGLRALNTILEALPTVNKITALRAGALNWRFFDASNGPNLTRCLDMAPNLTRIGFQIETGWDE